MSEPRTKLSDSYMTAVYLGPSASGKTKTFRIEGANGLPLGEVKWYAPWRRFCFFVIEPNVLFDGACLHALADFCQSETKAQQGRQKERRSALGDQP